MPPFLLGVCVCTLPCIVFPLKVEFEPTASHQRQDFRPRRAVLPSLVSFKSTRKEPARNELVIPCTLVRYCNRKTRSVSTYKYHSFLYWRLRLIGVVFFHFWRSCGCVFLILEILVSSTFSTFIFQSNFDDYFKQNHAFDVTYNDYNSFHTSDYHKKEGCEESNLHIYENQLRIVGKPAAYRRQSRKS
jgi:hypothetical protein